MGTAEATVTCKWCGASLLPNHSGPCPECGKRGKQISLTLKEALGLRSELGLKLKGPKGKRKRVREIKSRVSRDFERRTVKKRGESKEETSVIMIDWKDRRISHIHCKRCGNEWRDGEKEEMTEKFDISATTPSGTFRIKCRCGREVMSG